MDVEERDRACERQDAGGEEVTRRQFTTLVTASLASALLEMTAATASGQPLPAGEYGDNAQEKQPMSAEEDPRIALLEKERSAPFTPDQRKGLPAQLKELDDGAATLRKFPLADGGSEPHIVFQPVRLHDKLNPR